MASGAEPVLAVEAIHTAYGLSRVLFGVSFRVAPGAAGRIHRRARVRAVPGAPRATRPAGRLSLRRRAANAHRRAYPHGEPGAPAPRRAFRGPRPARRPPSTGADRPAQGRRPHHPPRRAERGLLPESRGPRVRAREGTRLLRGYLARVSRGRIDPPAVPGALSGHSLAPP